MTLEEMIVERVQPEVMILLISHMQDALDHLGMTGTHTHVLHTDRFPNQPRHSGHILTQT